MRRMGIYLGLVEDDDVRQYAGRYEGRPGDHGYADERHPDDRRYPRYRGDESYDERYDDPAYRGRAGEHPGYAEAPYADDVPAPEPVARRVAPARPLGLAPSGGAPAGGSAGGGAAARAGISGASASGLASRDSTAREPALREPVLREVAPVAVVPEPAPAPAPQPYRITTLHPRTYNEARAIGERFRDGMPVIMNLTEMDDADAKRLVDFAAGSVVRPAR